MKHNFIKEVSNKLKPEYKFRYSICTIVTRLGEYEEMVESFLHGGFNQAICEYLFLDNSAGNVADAFKAYNLFLQTAQGEYIIICHQDIELLTDGIQQLDERIEELNFLDPSWAALGNAGVLNSNYTAMHITYPAPDGERRVGKLPAKVVSLDENFILVKNSANLCVSHDLFGFHLYGTDICRVAKFAGRTNWVIDFNLLHKSHGKKDASFYKLCDQMEEKYRTLSNEQMIGTTCTQLNFSSSWVRHRKAWFHRVYYAKKECKTNASVAPRLIGVKNYFFYLTFWLLHRLSRPAENLARFINHGLTRRKTYAALSLVKPDAISKNGISGERIDVGRTVTAGELASSKKQAFGTALRFHVIMPCARPENIPSLAKNYLHQVNHPFEVRWHILLQGPDEDPKGIRKCNECLDFIEDGWFATIADDTAQNPSLLTRLGKAIVENPNAGAFVFCLQGRKSSIKATPENAATDMIGGAQIILSREFIGENRYDWETYRERCDVKFVTMLFKAHPERFVFINDFSMQMNDMELIC